MDKNCPKCQEIAASERELDVRAQNLVVRVKSVCSPVRIRNNRRWRRFAWWCQFPYIGRFIFDKFNVPAGLEIEPEYYKEQWYRPEGSAIEAEAEALEKMKAKHLEHWGEETVHPIDYTDPAGYYTPLFTSRSECYQMCDRYSRVGLRPATPRKYDFSSAGGVDKFETDRLVIDAKSLNLVPISMCDIFAGRKIIFQFRGVI